MAFSVIYHLYADYVDLVTPIDSTSSLNLFLVIEFNGNTIDHSKWNLGI